LKSRIKTIGITLGDPAGIGPEVTAKALRLIHLPENIRIKVVGDEKIFRHYIRKCGPRISVIDLHGNFAHCRPGKPTKESARASFLYLKTALALIRKKEIDALVTAPVSKEGISSLGINFRGHTEYLAGEFAVKKYEMMFVANNFRAVIITRHIPLSAVAREITPKQIFDAITLLNKVLKKNFRIKKPFIAVCGLNPHAGEKGIIGRDEIKTIIPALKRLQKQRINIAGPLSADTLFYPDHAKKYDAIVAMYHDQGLAPMKALYFDKLVNLTIGLPFIRTSPAHGTAFDIAGKNNANPSSMKAAIELAIHLA